MSNEEAIKILRSKMDGSVDTSYEWCECVRLAIKALEEQESPNSIRINFVGEEVRNLIPKSILEDIRAEIDSYCSDNRDRNDGLYIAMRIIDKHLHEIESEGKRRIEEMGRTS